MNVVIIGNGKVGSNLSTALVGEGHDVTVVDSHPDRLAKIQNALDVMCIEGNGATAEIQLEASVDKAGLFVAATLYAVFQASSILTSTGLAAADFNTWPLFSQIVLLFLMFVGGCAGSTSGGFKVQRLVILWKSGVVSLKKMVYPNSVNLVKSSDKTLSPESAHGVMRYLVIYLCIFVVAVLLVSLDNADFGTTVTAVFSCLNNIGPGIQEVGPMENYIFFSDFSKGMLSVVMLLGRLECLPLLMLMLPSVWRRDF